MHANQSLQTNMWPCQAQKITRKNLQIRAAGGKDLGYKATYLVLMQILAEK
jgi:hypothetical protein